MPDVRRVELLRKFLEKWFLKDRWFVIEKTKTKVVVGHFVKKGEWTWAKGKRCSR